MNLLHTPQVLSVAFVGLYAGAMLTEGLVLVPFWRRLPWRAFALGDLARGADLPQPGRAGGGTLSTGFEH